MILKKGTFMRKHMIGNLYNNIAGLQETLQEEGYEQIQTILDDLKYAFETDKEDYLMNLTWESGVKEIIDISTNWNVLTNDYPSGKYEKLFVDKSTTIRVKQSTKIKLNKIGERGDSFDDIINKLIEEHHFQ